MNRRERKLWAQARTLTDLGDLTARWLEGTIRSQPGYYGRPDPETTELIPVLAGLNRAGYVTESSQPGLGPVLGYDGKYWQQRAAVQGFADKDTLSQLETAIDGTDLLLIVHATETPRWWHRLAPWSLGAGDDAIAVTAHTEGQEYTWFGGQMTVSDIECCCDGVGDEAFDAILGAWQVTVVDPQWGRTDLLWDTLTVRFLAGVA